MGALEAYTGHTGAQHREGKGWQGTAQQRTAAQDWTLQMQNNL